MEVLQNGCIITACANYGVLSVNNIYQANVGEANLLISGAGVVVAKVYEEVGTERKIALNIEL